MTPEIRRLIEQWRTGDADDAKARGYWEAWNTYQVCANELDALLAAEPPPTEEGKPKRYDLIANYRAGSSIEEMEPSDDGEWVRYEDMAPPVEQERQEGLRVRLHALVAQMMVEAKESDEDGDICCALTRRHDAVAVLGVLGEQPASPSVVSEPPVGKLPIFARMMMESGDIPDERAKYDGPASPPPVDPPLLAGDDASREAAKRMSVRGPSPLPNEWLNVEEFRTLARTHRFPKRDLFAEQLSEALLRLADEVERLQAALRTHRCSGCGHQWDTPLFGAELCGDCWCKGQSAIFAPPVDPPPLGWHPIETAPQDHSWFLAWSEDLGYLVYRTGPGLIAAEEPDPTHWMPLPAPPAALRATPEGHA